MMIQILASVYSLSLSHLNTCAPEHLNTANVNTLENTLITIIIVSLFCNGLHIVTRPGMLLDFVDGWLYKFIFPARSEDIKPLHTQLYKPILGCIKCMASVWGVLIALLLMPFTWQLIFQIPIVCICASALNAILFQLYE